MLILLCNLLGNWPFDLLFLFILYEDKDILKLVMDLNLEFLKDRRLLSWLLIKGSVGEGLALFKQF